MYVLRITDMAGALWDTKRVAAQLECCKRMVQILVARGDLPAPLRLGRLVRWREEDISKWLEAKALAAQGGRGTTTKRATGRPRSSKRGV